MYKWVSFERPGDLINFLNEKKIKKENIIKIEEGSGRITHHLLFFDEDEN